MTPVILLLISAFSVSFILNRDSAERSASYTDLFEICKIIEERVRCERAPLVKIFDELDPALRLRLGDYRADGAPECLSRIVPTGNDEIVRLAEGVSDGGYESAVSFAKMLKNHTEKEMQRVIEEAKKGAPARNYLPVTASLLVSLLLI